jgi:hypothetical protein
VSLVRIHEELRERDERERETRRINSPKCSDMQRTRCDRPDTHTIYRQFTTYHTQQFVSCAAATQRIDCQRAGGEGGARGRGTRPAVARMRLLASRFWIARTGRAGLRCVAGARGCGPGSHARFVPLPCSVESTRRGTRMPS